MIDRIVHINTALDIFLENNQDAVVDSQIVRYQKLAKLCASGMFTESNAPLYPKIHEGIVKNNMIELKEDYSRHTKLTVNNTPVYLSMQHFMGTQNVNKNTEESSKYKAYLMDDHIAFNVIGGDKGGLNGLKFSHEYKSIPLVNGQYLIPINFVEPIVAYLEYNQVLQNAKRSGKGVTIMRELKRDYENLKNNAIANVEMPSWDELIQIGNFWESKVAAGFKNGNIQNFNKH